MKRLFLLFLVTAFTFMVSGQRAVDNLLKAKAFSESGQFDDAIRVLTTAIELSAEASLLTERAEAYIRKGDFSAAINDLNSANKIIPGSGEYGLARVYAIKRDVPTALYHLERNLTSDFKKSEKEVLLNPAFRNIENSPEWRQFWRRDWYNNYETGMAEIEFYASRGYPDDARLVLNKLAAAYAGDEGIVYAGALINVAEGNYSEAGKSLAVLATKHPSEEKYLRLFARTQEEMRNPSGASVTYTKLINLNIPDAGLFLSRAECYRKTGEYTKARTDIENYLKLYPVDKRAVSMAGRIELDAGDNLRALEFFSRNVKLYPDDPECHVDRANAYFLSRSWERAISDYAMSLDLMPDNSEAWLNKGISLLNSGKKDDACFDFRRSFRLGNKRAAEYISRNCIK